MVAWLWSCVPLRGQLAFLSPFRCFPAFSALFRPWNAVYWRFVGLIVSAGGLLGYPLYFAVLTRSLRGSLLVDSVFPDPSSPIVDGVPPE